MTLVIDASVAIKWVLPEEHSDAALALKSERLTAPDLWLSEATKALWKRMRLGELELPQAERLLSDLMGSPITAAPSAGLAMEALGLAEELRHPVYDCFYLALARRHDLQVVTADRRFATVVKSSAHRQHIRFLGG